MRPALLIALLVASSACGGSGTTDSATNPGTTVTPTVTTSVAMTGFAFTPADIQVSPGAVVTWTNNDAVNHNVTFTSTVVGAVANFSAGARTITMPTTTGTYAYHCTIHGAMTGTVKVQ